MLQVSRTTRPLVKADAARPVPPPCCSLAEAPAAPQLRAIASSPEHWSMPNDIRTGTRRVRATRIAGLALLVGLVHFGLSVVALRALLAGHATSTGPPIWVSAAFALLGFPFFYMPFRPTLGGHMPAGWVVTALNATFWMVVVGGTALLLQRRRSAPARAK
jgi:hypothetical protein